MKRLLSIFIVFLAALLAACAPLEASQPVPTSTPAIIVQTAAPANIMTVPVNTLPVVVATAQVNGVEVSSATVMPMVTTPVTVERGAGSTSDVLPADGVTLSDNGRTFVMHVGESFLLKLGMDIYDWSVEVDNQNILHREMNVMVIRGAQGIYIAQSPGTATLTATGNPLCSQSTPRCMMPSILFRIVLIIG